MSSPEYDCIIVGGGISGISFAHYLHSIGKKVLVIEKKDKVGGQIQTEHFQDSGFWYELGAHTCYNKYISILSIVKDLNCQNIVQPLEKHSFLLYTEKGLKKIASAINIPSMLFHCLTAFRTPREGKTVKEYFTKLTGSRNYDQLFSKAFRAIISQNADEYPAELLVKSRKIRLKEFPAKYSFTQGLSSLVDTIVERNGFPVEVSGTVTGIHRLEAGKDAVYEINLASGKKMHASSIAVATDPQTASMLLKEIESPLSGLLSTIAISGSESLSILVEKDKVQAKKLGGIIPLSDDFLSVVSRDLLDHPTLRGFTFHFPKGEKTIDEQVAVACEVLQIEQSAILHQSTTNHVLPCLRLSHLNMAGQVAKKMTNTGIYLLGNYFGGVSMEDCVQRSFEEFERFKSLLHTGVFLS